MNLKMNTLHIAVFLATVVSLQCTDVCDKSQKVEWKPDPSDCSIFYMCFGKLQHKYSCPEDTVYNEVKRSCVKTGSEDDKCTKKRPFSIQEKCKTSNSFFLQDDSSCSKYIDCSSYTVEQCYYPFLFDENTKRCTPPEIAECRSRLAPKDPCDYMENDCRSSLGCVPCTARFPSCQGLQDGLNSWPEREGSPYYVVCKHERVVYQDQCDFENKKEIFHPEKRTCLTM